MTKELDAKDSLMDAAAESQRANGMLPTVVDNAKFLTPILEKLEPKETPKPTTEARDKDAAFDAELQKRCRRHGIPYMPNYRIDKTKIPLAMGGQALTLKIMDVAEKRLRARMRMLLAHPDWAPKIKALNPMALQGYMGPDRREAEVSKVRKILAAADKAFGLWGKGPAARPLYFGGKV